MAIPISNQATVTYTGSGGDASAVSNTAGTPWKSGLSLTKTIYDDHYRPGQILTHLLHIRNSGAPPSLLAGGLTVKDDLGSFTADGVTALPLTYRSYQLYLDGELNETVPVNVCVDLCGVCFALGALPSDFSLLTLVYQAEVNEYAPLTPCTDRIVGSASLFAGNTLLDTDSAASAADCCARLTIEKSLSPNPVENGAPITYRFVLRNYGNADPTAVTLQDIFFPPLTAPLSVTLNGQAVNCYSYNPVTGEFLLGAAASPACTVPVPAAAVLRDPITGAYTPSPGETVITVTGKIFA